METFVYNPTDSKSRGNLLTRSFGYMFAGILITCVVAVAVGLLLTNMLFGTPFVDFNANYEIVNQNAGSFVIGLMIASGILVLICTIVFNVALLKKSKVSLVAGIVYCVLMGVLLSSFTLYLPWEVIGIAFGITCLLFGGLCLIGLLSKGNLNILGILGFGILFGAMIVGLVYWLVFSRIANQDTRNLYLIITIATFAAILMITVWDVWRIKQIAATGENSQNLALYCAFTLYTDFIYILIRVLQFVALSRE